MKTIYLAPSNLEEVLEPLGEDPDGTMVMAGGTALLWAVRLFGEPVKPGRVISLQNLSGPLGQVRRDSESVMELGALVSLATLAGEVPGETVMPSILARACKSCGFPGIRRTATLGGNLANSMLSQLLPALAVLGASVHTRSGSEDRMVDLAKSISEGDYYPICFPGEVITSVSIPTDSVEARQSYVDFACPGKLPVVVASAFWKGLLRVALLSDQKLCLWVTETDGIMLEKKEVELSDAACVSLGLTDSSALSEIDAYRRRSMVARALKLTIVENEPTSGV